MAFDFYEWSMRAYLKWKTARRGKKVGSDPVGNDYYVDKRSSGTRQERRWVVFAGESEASNVPPEWHGWLHHQVKDPPTGDSPYRQSWQKDPVPNLTGTVDAYRPPGSTLAGAERARSGSDYEPWTPS